MPTTEPIATRSVPTCAQPPHLCPPSHPVFRQHQPLNQPLHSSSTAALTKQSSPTVTHPYLLLWLQRRAQRALTWIMTRSQPLRASRETTTNRSSSTHYRAIGLFPGAKSPRPRMRTAVFAMFCGRACCTFGGIRLPKQSTLCLTALTWTTFHTRATTRSRNFITTSESSCGQREA